MTDDTEARLRAALNAYADLVDEPDAELPRPVPPVSARRSALRRWRGPAMVAAAVVVVSGGAWWAVADRPGGDVVAGASTAGESGPTSAADEAAPAPESPTGEALDSGAATSAEAVAALPPVPEVGVPYLLDLYTHCGVFGADVGGTWFALDPPLVDGPGNPPDGWGNPYQAGVLTLTTPDDAVFTDDQGHDVALRAAPDSARPVPCD